MRLANSEVRRQAPFFQVSALGRGHRSPIGVCAQLVGRIQVARCSSWISWVLVCLLSVAQAAEAGDESAPADGGWESTVLAAKSSMAKGADAQAVQLARKALAQGAAASITSDNVATIRNVLAVALANTGAYREAREQLNFVLKTRRAAGTPPLRLMDVRLNCVDVELDAEDFIAAEKYFSEAVKLANQVPFDSSSARGIEAIAIAGTRLGRYEPALRMALASLVARRKLPQASDRVEWMSKFGVAGACYHLGKYEACEAALKDCVRRATQRFGRSHPVTLRLLLRLAQAHIRRSKLDPARFVLNDWDVDSPRAGDRLSVRDRALRLIVESDLLLAHVKPQKARVALEAAMKQLRVAKLENRSEFARCQMLLGKIDRGKPERALSHYLVAEKIFIARMGKSHPETLRARILVIQCRAERDASAPIPAEHKKLVDELAESIGAEHPDIQSYRSWRRE